MLSDSLLLVRQDHLDRLRHARRAGPRRCSQRPALHLQLTSPSRTEAAAIAALAERIEAAHAAALDALTHTTAGQSLCTLGHERLNAAKYHEGAVVALSDARRAVRRGTAPPMAEEWGRGPVQIQAQTSASWRAYLVGGRDALTAAYQSIPEGAPAATS